MITRETHKLIGLVKEVEVDFAVFENIEEILKETRHQSAGYSIYDFEGKLVEEVSPYRLMMYDAYKDIYYYDEKGELDYRDEYDKDNLLFGKTIFEKSVDGNLIEKHYYFDKKNLRLGSHFIFDGENNDSEECCIIEIAHYDKNEKIIPRHFHRESTAERNKKNIVSDKNGYTIEEFRNSKNGKFTDKTITSYDSKGNIKEFSCFKQDGTIDLKDVYDYKFDSIGNWIEQIQNHWVIGWGEFKLIPISITRRKIEYFD